VRVTYCEPSPSLPPQGLAVGGLFWGNLGSPLILQEVGMKKPFGFRIPAVIPEGMRDEYLKWCKDPYKYESLYPVTAKIIQSLLEKESEDDLRNDG
jgi:hypothetical protein